MLSRPRATASAFTQRSIPALVLGGLLLAWAPILASPAHAAQQVRDHRGEQQPARPPGAASDPATVRDHRDVDAAARLQVVVNYVHIVDDGDWWGKGEFALWVRVDRYQGCQNGGDPLRDGCGAYRGYVSEDFRFSASSGTFYEPYRAVPSERSDNRDPGAAPAAGIAVQLGEVLAVRFGASEDDPLPDTRFEHGVLQSDLVLRERDGWSVGRHSQQIRRDGFDLTVYYEVRRTPLPDLVPHNIRQLVLDDGRPVVCPSVLNQGQRPSAPFQIALQVDGVVPAWGTFQAGALAVGEVTEHCFLVDTLSPGPHRFAVRVDTPRQVTEMDETNNGSPEQTLALRSAGSGQSGPPVGPTTITPERPRAAR